MMNPGPKTAKVVRYLMFALFALPVLLVGIIRSVANFFDIVATQSEITILNLTKSIGAKLGKWEDNCPERLMGILQEQGKDE